MRWRVALGVLAVFLLLTRPAGALAQETTATLELSPSSGPPGTEVNADGEGYDDCDSVTLSFSEDGEGLETGDVDEDGEISVSFTVPDVTVGEKTVTTSCGDAAATFTVTALPPSPPDGEPFSPSPLPSPFPSPPPGPPPPPPPPPGSTLEAIQNLVDRELEKGVILYNPPEQMRVDETVRVEVRISREFSEGIREGLRGPGAPRVEELQVGTFMKVELKGPAFDITPIGSDVQPLLAVGFTEWRWDVRPTVSGNHPLYLVATVVHEGTVVRETPPFERRIDVAVNPAYWMKTNWEKVLGGLCAVVGLTEAYRRFRLKHKGE